MSEQTPSISVRDASLTIHRPDGAVPILRGVDLDLHRGETLGLVGESGSGKSMTARLMSGLVPRDAEVRGSVQVKGSTVPLTDRAAWRKVRAHGVALVFQDPRAHLDPVRSIGDFLTEAQVKVHGRRRADAEARAVHALVEVGVSQASARLRQYPHELSGGLLQRVMIASALLSEPEVLLADEPTTALDVTTQSELISIIRELQSERGMAVLFITHDLDLAAAVCDRVMVMYAGEIVEAGPPSILETAPLHPYTVGLLAARPDAFGERRRLVQLEGSPISASEAGAGCAFRLRCPVAVDACSTIHPSLTAAGDRAWRCLQVEAPAVAGGES